MTPQPNASAGTTVPNKAVPEWATRASTQWHEREKRLWESSGYPFEFNDYDVAEMAKHFAYHARNDAPSVPAVGGVREAELPTAISEAVKVAVCFAPQLNDLPAGHLRPLIDRILAALTPYLSNVQGAAGVPGYTAKEVGEFLDELLSMAIKWECRQDPHFKDWPDARTIIEHIKTKVLAAHATGKQAEGARDGAALIAEERRRQISDEDWTPEHDDQHRFAEIAQNAALLVVDGTDATVDLHGEAIDWGLAEKHKDNRIRQLVIAGALIAAEIDRLQRAALRSSNQTGEARG